MREIRAEVSGTVWKIEAAAGDRLSAGDAVLILESMKMEIPVEAPADGIVREILVKEGDLVEEDQPLARMETV